MAVVEPEPLLSLEDESDFPDADDADEADEWLESERLEALELPEVDPELLELEGLGEAVTTSFPPTKTSKAESTDTALLSMVTGPAPGTSVVLSMTILVGFTVKVSLPMTMVSAGCGTAWALLLPTRSSNKRKRSEEMKKCW